MNEDELIKFKSLVSDLYGYYSENDELDNLIDEIFDKAMKLKSEVKPLSLGGIVCPKCNSKLKPRYYRGYYDEFPYWECGCYGDNEFFTKNIRMGAYT